jgi:uncharacterized protein (DUF1330 family)
MEETAMNTTYLMSIAFGLGAAFGTTALTGLRAQGETVGAYFVTEIDITDEDAYLNRYAPKVMTTMTPFGGHYLSRGAKVGAIDGPAPKRVAIIGFESVEKAQAWRNSPAYRELIPLRDRGAKIKSYAVEAKVN